MFKNQPDVLIDPRLDWAIKNHEEEMIEKFPEDVLSYDYEATNNKLANTRMMWLAENNPEMLFTHYSNVARLLRPVHCSNFMKLNTP